MAHNHKHQIKGIKLVVVTIMNIVITVAEIVGGLVSGSLSLISDALHNFSDGVAVVISYMALRISSREHTLKHTFGYKRIEILAALFNASVLVIISFFLFKEAYMRLIHPVKIKSVLMLIVASIGLLANAISVLLLKKDSHSSINIKSAYLHLLADTLSSLAIITGGLFILFFNLTWIDPVLTVIIGAYVLFESGGIVKKAFDILMDKVPPHIDIKLIKREVEELEEVKNIHHIHVWQISEHNIMFEAHVDVDRDMNIVESTSLIKRIEKILRDKFGIDHSTIQIECDACVDKGIIKRNHVKISGGE